MEVLTDCDINVVIYSTHSTRNTSASKSFTQGLSDKKLLKKLAGTKTLLSGKIIISLLCLMIQQNSQQAVFQLIFMTMFNKFVQV